MEGKNSRITIHRELSTEEFEEFREHEDCVTEATNRLKLIRITELNYDILTDFFKEYKATEGSNDPRMLRTQQHFMNFLNTAYALTEHFESKVNKHNKDQSGLLASYNEFKNKLRKKSFAFAFFSSYRNYAQHQELPVANMPVKYDAGGFSFGLIENRESFLKDKRNTKHIPHEIPDQIELIPLAKQYFDILKNEYSRYIALFYLSAIYPAHEFFKALSAEVNLQKPLDKAILMRGLSINAPVSQIDVREVIPDVMAHVGIEIKKEAIGCSIPGEA